MDRPLSFAMDLPGWEPPEPPSAERCGMGEGALCCKFLMMGPDGIECARFTDMHPMLVGRAMGSQFIPDQEDCQAERRRVVAQQVCGATEELDGPYRRTCTLPPHPPEEPHAWTTGERIGS